MKTFKNFSPKNDSQIDWVHVDENSLDMLDRARTLAGVPFRITSNYRTKEQDIALAGFAGAHTEIPCTSFDIAASNGKQRFAIIKALFEVGFPRIGVNVKNNHIHVDNSQILPRMVFFVE